jgi:AmmeMemoRadiSam system protein B
MIRIRQAAVAGSFYPAHSEELRGEVQRLLGAVAAVEGPKPRALLVPHAGYIYSGPVAANAYARLIPWKHDYRRVLLLGPCHRTALAGMALSSAETFETPLGEIPLDRESIASLHHPDLVISDEAHRMEHSLEVQLPFLQCVLDAFALVPVVVGDARPEAVSDLIESLWGESGTLVVVSSDLSHYLDYPEARRRDQATCDAIETLDGKRIGYSEACGATPLRGLLDAANRHSLQAQTLDLRNSGDTAGTRDRVVGYGAWMFVEKASCQHAA